MEKIRQLYGDKFVPAEPRNYQKKKVKGAQEAHEAIRPAGTEMPAPNETKLKAAKLALYELIWKRTMASQMVDGQLQQVSAKIEVGTSVFSASGQTVSFPGFLKVYSDDSKDNNEKKLPELKQGDVLGLKSVQDREHETKPPARYTEASLVQKMEKEGIGRPSTYASIISTVSRSRLCDEKRWGLGSYVYGHGGFTFIKRSFTKFCGSWLYLTNGKVAR